MPFYSRVLQSTVTPEPMASQRHWPLSILQLVTRLFFSQTHAAREARPSAGAGSRPRRATEPGRTNKAAPRRPGVACPHPPLPPGHPPSLPERRGFPRGSPAPSAPRRAGERCRCPAIGGGPRTGELGQERGGQRGAATHSSGQRRLRRTAAAGAQPRRAASWLGRAAGRGKAAGGSSGTRAERDRCVRGSGGGAV